MPRSYYSQNVLLAIDRCLPHKHTMRAMNAPLSDVSLILVFALVARQLLLFTSVT